ncbi:MAG: histone deacetylase family protein [Gammaproteobacteria bacterium]|nr:histone deacetylase family protein [Gammaproteobacteria bacterium]
MRTALLQHPDDALHRMQSRHPECPERTTVIIERLEHSGLADDLIRPPVPEPVSDADLARVHPIEHIEGLWQRLPRQGLTPVDGDTFLAPGSIRAARAAAGAAVAATDGVLHGAFERAFCAIRPPGHHAETSLAMGFCFFNSIAVAARRALEVHGLERVAILDFDVHHGNGSAEIFAHDPRVMVCSSFQHPFYPGRGTDVAGNHIVLTPLPEGTGSGAFRRAIERDWIPAIERHRPELILVSAGFDAHRDDPLGGLELVTDDYRWITELIGALAHDCANDRIVSLLEGGYDLAALAASAEAHVTALAGR